MRFGLVLVVLGMIACSRAVDPAPAPKESAEAVNGNAMNSPTLSRERMPALRAVQLDKQNSSIVKLEAIRDAAIGEAQTPAQSGDAGH